MSDEVDLRKKTARQRVVASSLVGEDERFAGGAERPWQFRQLGQTWFIACSGEGKPIHLNLDSNAVKYGDCEL